MKSSKTESAESKEKAVKKAKRLERKDLRRFDADALWKDLIERFFYPMLMRAVPSLYDDADLSQPVRFLDKELRQVVKRVGEKAKVADYLVDVPLKDGTNTWILLHVEIRAPRACETYKRKRLYGMPLLKQEVTRKSMSHLCCEGW